MTLIEIETIIKSHVGDNWAYVGGYATYLHIEEAKRKGASIDTIKYGDYDIVVGGEKHGAIRGEVYVDDEQPVIGKHPVSILSSVVPERIKIGNSNVATAKFLADNYLNKLSIAYNGRLGRPSMAELMEKDIAEIIEMFRKVGDEKTEEGIIKDRIRYNRANTLRKLQ